MKLLSIVTLLLLLLASCEKEIPLEQEEKEPRIVVNGIFSAGDTIRIHLSESRDVLYEGTLPDLTLATAKLYDSDNNLIGNFVHEGYGIYKLENYSPAAGKTYNITVSNTGFNSVSSQTYTPSIISVNSIDTLQKADQMTYEIKFTDDGNVSNYYAITIDKITIVEDEFSGEFYSYTETYFETSEIFTQGGSEDVDGSKWGNIFLFSDATFNGGECSFSAENYMYPESSDSVIVVINLLSLSEDYYKYHVSLSKYQETQGSPFAQPVQVYSNIENGFGIFGAYSIYSDTLFFE